MTRKTRKVCRLKQVRIMIEIKIAAKRYAFRYFFPASIDLIEAATLSTALPRVHYLKGLAQLEIGRERKVRFQTVALMIVCE